MSAMIFYPADAAQKLEFDKILELLVSFCHGEGAKDLARDLVPRTDRGQIELQLNQTAEFKSLRDEGAYFPSTRLPSVKKELQLLAIPNSVLEGKQLMNLCEMVDVAHQAITFLEDRKEVYPALAEITAPLTKASGLEDIFRKILEPNGFVKSSASRELEQIRRELGVLRQRSNRIFEQQVRKFQKLGWLRDFEESFYNNRRVLAVMAEHKRKIEGMLHGESETGSTAFIEPGAMVEVNNLMQETREAEKREEYRILSELTRSVRPWLPHLRSFEAALSQLDFTEGKAKLAQRLNAFRPGLRQKGDIALVEARHPVLVLQKAQEESVVIPLHVNLDSRKRILVISGPNAGGKSIALKTLGLLQIMLQSGLLVPCASESEFRLFDQLFVDIGDDQSIAYELSTYSSRLVKMKHFLFHAHARTLFLIDEFGTGSDPELGGAMAEVILEELSATKAMGVVTTHYGNIKVLAEQHEHLQNASMLFDERTLQPRFILNQGAAGSSYTFEVAAQIGLDKELINRAKAKLDGKKVKFDQLLVTIQARKNEMNRELHQLKEQRGKLKRDAEDYQRELASLEAQREKLNLDSSRALMDKGKKFESLIEFYIKTKNKKELTRKVVIAAEKEVQKEQQTDLVEKIRSKQKTRQARKKKKKEEEELSVAPKKALAVGDTVHLKGSKQRGIIEEIEKGRATVVFGNMRTRVSVDELLGAI